MGTIVKPNTYSAGTPIVASEHNSNDDVIYEEFNGNIENTNIKAGAAIANNKLAAPKSFFTMVIKHEGQETSTVDPITIFQMPFAATLTEVSVAARATDNGNANETYTVDVEEAGTSVLSSAISIDRDAPQTPVVGTVSDASIADNAKMTVVLTLGGSSPSIDDLTVLLVWKIAHTS